VSAVATTPETNDVPMLTTPSAHHQRHAQFTTPPSLLTAGAWLNATAQTVLDAEPSAEYVDCRVYRLKKGADGQFGMHVVKTMRKHREYAANNPTSFARYDGGNGTLLDAFFSGVGEGATLREQDAAKLMVSWANTVQPDPQTALQASRAFTMRCAIRRGCVIYSHEAI
jgi:hypothetical protein